MTKTRVQLLQEAIGWTIRLRDAEAESWEEFTAWLEADPTHLSAYEEVASLDAELDGLPKEPRRLIRDEGPASTAEPRARAPARRAFLGVAIAAALVGIIGYTGFQEKEGARYAVETRPGEQRLIALAEGSRIHLNGGSRILLDKGDPRFARLERGEALFHVVHDPDTTFRVEAGDAVVQDLGTVFNVAHQGETVEVEVAEGAVLLSAGGRKVSLEEGATAIKSTNGITTGRRPASEIGAWQRGQLSYSAASISEIAADLSRSTGLIVRASPEVAGRRFSGVIVLDKDHERLLRRVSALLAVDARQTDQGWILSAEAR